jgi:flagellin
MASYINTNMASLNSQRNLTQSQGALNTSLQRLSSGLRVNSAKDDASGLAIAERINAQVKGLNVAIRNANDGISLSQTAEGALGVIGSNYQRMRELAVQASNINTTGGGATAAADLASLDAEYKQLDTENKRVITATEFNGVKLLNAAVSQNFQIGANTADVLTVTTAAAVAGTNTGTLGSTQATALAELAKLDADISQVNSTRATWGATQSRFEAIISNVSNAAENLTAARSRIMDTDYAAETANLTRAQILQQAGTAMLAQANQAPQSIMSLLR